MNLRRNTCEQQKQGSPSGVAPAGPVATKIADAGLPVLGFLVGYTVWGVLVGVAGALVGATIVASWRISRGERLRVIAIATALVLLRALLALLTDEGRNFFLPDLIRNSAFLVILAGSLIAMRPLSALVDRIPLPFLESVRQAPRAAHMRVTGSWTAAVALRLVIIVPLYLANNVWWLGLAQFLLGYPLLVLLGWWSAGYLRAASRRKDVDRGG